MREADKITHHENGIWNYDKKVTREHDFQAKRGIGTTVQQPAFSAYRIRNSG
ncbi:hypothetical protein OIDMADRAFT_19789 [Oidiodendron maius Zn]|uniref:Uncharacterized protein n=1 Tax=Oidiodendron maius (strain Zn) TaxID=913774 RepID=A0A0C3DD01_OIDMZ|nr:hypothetical protein OIDMADRAFT_19789 [Oidiodendron maius Zn]